jgi:hypothetical protein
MVFSVSRLGRRGSGSGWELPRWRRGGSATSKLGVIQEFWLGCLAVAGLWGISFAWLPIYKSGCSGGNLNFLNKF